MVSIVSAIAQAAAIAPSSAGARIGQRSMATMRCARGAAKPTLSTSRLAAARVQHHAAAAFAVGVDQVVDRRVEPGLRQRLDHKAALPVAIARRRPVLERAAAAGAEMRTDRRDPLRARGLDRDRAAGGRDGRARPRPRRFRRAARTAQRPARPACRRCRRRAGRAAQSSDVRPWPAIAGDGAPRPAHHGDRRQVATRGQAVEAPDQQQRQTATG